jgi:DNA-binding winged helix-turn-helix (wHTH) protein
VKVSFGDFELDGSTRQLSRAGQVMHLSPKAFDLLTILVEGRPKAFSKEELLRRVWPAVFVSEANLASVVAEIRRTIGDSSRKPQFVRTAYGYGYAFSGPATDLSKNGRPQLSDVNCWLTSGNARFPLAEGENLIGKNPDADVWLDSDSVSRRHAKIVVKGCDATLEDYPSKNGTFLHGKRITAAVQLADGDAIKIGRFVLRFRVRSSYASVTTKTR